MSNEIPPTQIPPFEDVMAIDVEGYIPNFTSPEDFVRGHEDPKQWDPAVIAIAYRPAIEEGWIEYYHDFGEEPNPERVVNDAMECIRLEIPDDAKLISYNGTRYDVDMMASTSKITPLIGREHYDLHRWVEYLDGRKMRLEETLERHGAAIETEKPNSAAQIAADIANGRTNGEVLNLLKYLEADIRRLPELADKLHRRFKSMNEDPPSWTVQGYADKNLRGNSVATDGGLEND